MVSLRTVSVIALLALAAGPVGAEISTFDTTDEGWTYVGDVNSYGWADTDGNPDGYLRTVDSASGPIIYLIAPAKFLGDKSAYDGEVLRFDYNLFSRSGGSLSAFGQVAITGSSGSATVDLGPVPANVNTWTPYSIDMTAAAWGLTQPQWDALLADVTDIRVRAEAINGNETFGMDNFEITPEPTSLALLAAGGIASLGRRRR